MRIKKKQIERYGQDNRLLVVPIAMLFAMLALFAIIASRVLFTPIDDRPIPTAPALVAALPARSYTLYVPVVVNTSTYTLYLPALYG